MYDREDDQEEQESVLSLSLPTEEQEKCDDEMKKI